MGPTPWRDELLLNPVQDVHILTIIEEEIEYNSMNLWQQEISTVTVNFNDAVLYLLVVTLIQFYLIYFRDEHLDVFPLRTVYLLQKQEDKDVNFIFARQIQNLQQIFIEKHVSLNVEFMKTNPLQNLLF